MMGRTLCPLFGGRWTSDVVLSLLCCFLNTSNHAVLRFCLQHFWA